MRGCGRNQPERFSLMTASLHTIPDLASGAQAITAFGPDFPFPFDDWIKHPAGLGVFQPSGMDRKWRSSARAIAGVRRGAMS